MMRLFSKKGPLLHNLARNFNNSNKKKDYYGILGLQKNATQTDIKKAFAKLAREHHPDTNPNPQSKDKFAEISEAYQTLSDDKKRQVYDQYGMSSDDQKQYENMGFGGPNDFSGFQDMFGQGFGQNSGFENIFRGFEDFFKGDDSKSNRPSRGQDVVINLEIGFMDSVNGLNKEISYSVKDQCNVCNGNRCKPGTSPTKCTTCAGKGTVTYKQGPMHIQMGCNACRGEGTTIKNPCSNCRGSGVANSVLKENLSIPKGINTGQNIRVSGKGNKGESGGPSGDLIIKVSVQTDPHFRREGYDIYTDKTISISQAVLGTELDIKTIYGSKKIVIPAGSSSGHKIRIQNEGITKLPPNQSQKGDHYVILSVQIPSKLTNQQKEIFKQLKDLEEDKLKATGGTGCSKDKGFLKTFENFFEKKESS